jgi:hypothetical protein
MAGAAKAAPAKAPEALFIAGTGPRVRILAAALYPGVLVLSHADELAAVMAAAPGLAGSAAVRILGEAEVDATARAGAIAWLRENRAADRPLAPLDAFLRWGLGAWTPDGVIVDDEIAALLAPPPATAEDLAAARTEDQLLAALCRHFEATGGTFELVHDARYVRPCDRPRSGVFAGSPAWWQFVSADGAIRRRYRVLNGIRPDTRLEALRHAVATPRDLAAETLAALLGADIETASFDPTTSREMQHGYAVPVEVPGWTFTAANVSAQTWAHPHQGGRERAAEYIAGIIRASGVKVATPEAERLFARPNVASDIAERTFARAGDHGPAERG